MDKKPNNETHTQLTGNIGLYYVCYRLSCLGWNAMPTSRNARGIDILAYSRDCSHIISLQVKTLSKKTPVPLGKDISKIIGDFWVIVNDVLNDPKVYILAPEEVKKKAHRGEKDGRVSYWLQATSYELDKFKDAWQRLGNP